VQKNQTGFFQETFRCDATITNPTKEEKEITSVVASPEILGCQNV